MNALPIFNMKGSLTDKGTAKLIAQRLFDIYDRDKSGVIESHELGFLIEDSYKTINKYNRHTSDDVETLKEVMDKDEDGKVTLRDLEILVSKYLLGREGTL